jgi:hypothetical protein
MLIMLQQHLKQYIPNEILTGVEILFNILLILIITLPNCVVVRIVFDRSHIFEK